MDKIPFSRRVTVMLIDFIVALVYSILIMLLIVTISVGVLDGIPRLSHIQMQTLAIFTLTMPLILLFTLLEMLEPFGTFGKRVSGLQLNYKQTAFISSFLRNLFKFIPWMFIQGGIIGMFYSSNNWIYFTLILFGIGYAVINLRMMYVREDGRHIADLIAGTYVKKRENSDGER